MGLIWGLGLPWGRSQSQLVHAGRGESVLEAALSEKGPCDHGKSRVTRPPAHAAELDLTACVWCTLDSSESVLWSCWLIPHVTSPPPERLCCVTETPIPKEKFFPLIQGKPSPSQGILECDGE